MRSAVNMLYASAIGRESLGGDQVHTTQKDERVSIFSLVSAVFSKTSDENLMKLSWDVDDTPEDIEQWVEGSVHTITDRDAVGRAYISLARADEYIGYTYRRQYHTLWRYATAVMLLGVADAAGGKGIHARILPPERWQKMSTAKKQKAIRSSVLSRLAATMQLPQATLREKYLGIISLLVELDPGTFTRELMLDAEGLNFFLNDRARAQEIVKAVTKTERDKELEQKKKDRKTKTGTAGGESDPASPAETKPPVGQAVMPPEEQTTVPPPAPDASDRKPAVNNQSTLFDGF
jgi:replication factor C large subunit